ncbi:hypothetical protein [Chlorobium ferrooxidans]|nr:hypothetical protein [Chlorobium ferrooxidans]
MDPILEEGYVYVRGWLFAFRVIKSLIKQPGVIMKGQGRPSARITKGAKKITAMYSADDMDGHSEDAAGGWDGG